MALPAQAVEKIIREPSDTQGAYRQLLLLTASLFILTLLIYAGIAFGYKAYLKSAVGTLEKKISDSSTAVSAEEEARIATFYSQLMNLRTLLGSHRSISPIFALLERTATPNIYYTKISLNGSTNELALSGAARNLGDIAAEAAVFEKQPEVDHVNINNGAISPNSPWQFAMSVFLNPKNLKPLPSSNTSAFNPTASSSASSTTPVASSTATSTRR
jgi:hypothetical protein